MKKRRRRDIQDILAALQRCALPATPNAVALQLGCQPPYVRKLVAQNRKAFEAAGWTIKREKSSHIWGKQQFRYVYVRAKQQREAP